MKNTLMMMAGAAMGIAMYKEMEMLSKNKNTIKRKVNTVIDKSANMMN